LACEAPFNRRGDSSATKDLGLPKRVPGTSEINADLGPGLFSRLITPSGIIASVLGFAYGQGTHS
jgi:hypothetical protein